jgi:hypothetical protein
MVRKLNPILCRTCSQLNAFRSGIMQFTLWVFFGGIARGFVYVSILKNDMVFKMLKTELEPFGLLLAGLLIFRLDLDL